MDGRTSVTEENEKVYYRAGAALLLAALAVGAWLLFAVRFGDPSGDQTTALGIWLGVAVSLTVFAAATGVVAAMTAMHNEQMRALRDR